MKACLAYRGQGNDLYPDGGGICAAASRAGAGHVEDGYLRAGDHEQLGAVHVLPQPLIVLHLQYSAA